MEELPLPQVVNEWRTVLAQVEEPDEFLLQTALNEAWFSNTLAWLLNPRGSHGLGVAFAEAFVLRVAQRRTDGARKKRYVRRESFLKYGKAGRGTGATSFSFRNATPLREYYLSRAIDRSAARNSRYCDVVLLDLDSADGFFLAIENKLFTSDRAQQLRDYRDAIEEKYARARVREFVYLTLRGDPPVLGSDEENRQWVSLSWVQDIRDVLTALTTAKTSEHSSLEGLIRLLHWLEHITDLARISKQQRVELKTRLLRAAAECLVEELVRLDKHGEGRWMLAESTEAGERIRHSSRPAAYLSVQLTPGLTVTIQGQRSGGKAEFSKIVVPFGAHPDQVINLLDLAARDLYHQFFTNASLYLGDARRLTVSATPKEVEHRPLFEFMNDYRHALKPMLLQSEAVRQAVGIREEEVAEAQ